MEEKNIKKRDRAILQEIKKSFPFSNHSFCGDSYRFLITKIIGGGSSATCFRHLISGSLALQPAGLLNSPMEPLSESLALQVTPYTSLKLHGR
jgi:hypothetical protein